MIEDLTLADRLALQASDIAHRLGMRVSINLAA